MSTHPVRTLGRIGFRAGLAAFGATVAYDVVQILQVVGALHFPADDVLIFLTSLCIVVPFVLEMLALHHTTPLGERFWTHAAVVFTTMYAVFGSANYIVQLGTVIPARLRGAEDSVRFLEQTPHSLLWNFDAIAYIAMGLATAMAIPALRDTGTERRVRFAAMAHVAATLLSCVVYFAPVFSNRLLMVGLPWAVTAPLFMILLAFALRARDTARAT